MLAAMLTACRTARRGKAAGMMAVEAPARIDATKIPLATLASIANANVDKDWQRGVPALQIANARRGGA